MPEQVVHVECYSGFKADERPLRLHLIDGPREVVATDDRWYSPGATYFRVLLDDGDRYLLRHDEAQDVWSIAGYRAAVAGQFPVSRDPGRIAELTRWSKSPATFHARRPATP